LSDLEMNPDIRIYQGISSSTEFLGFNMLKPPLNDIMVREAIALAIDYDAIINDVMAGRAQRSESPIPPNIFGYLDVPLRERNIEQAQQLLDDAGYSDGFDLTLTYNIENLVRRQVANVIRDSLDDIGINVKIQGLDWPSAIQLYLSMEHEMLLNGWTPDYFDADTYLSPQFHSFSSAPYGANVFGLNDSRLDELIDLGRSTTDDKLREEYYHEVQNIILEEIPIVNLFVPSISDAVRFNIKGWAFNPIELFDAYELFKE
jgi:peptide/nickel transport system substrate-binding protein